MAASRGHILEQIQRWVSPRLEEFSDAVLLTRFIQSRDELAFAALVARHGAMVLRSCRRILSDGHEAEDAFQATFLILARKAPSLRRPDALPGFLHSIARRVALKVRKKTAVHASQTPLADDLSDTRFDPLAQLTARELLTVLDEEVARLPRAQRSAVVLCCLEGRTQEEAARLLGWTTGSLRGHLERGRHRLQARLQRRGITLAAALAVLVVSRSEAVPALLLHSTVKTALQGGIGSTASALAHSVLQAMFLPKLAGAMVVTLTLALAASTTAVLVYRGPATEVPEENKRAVSAHRKEAGADKPQVRTDALGDPLPPGAIARMGTLRLYHYGCLCALVFSPDSKTIVSAGNFGDIRLWDAATGKELRTISAYKEPISDVVFSPNGKLLVGSCHFDPTIRVWETATGAELHRMLGDPDSIRALAFSSDGKLLASAGQDHSIRLWDAAGWKELHRLKGHSEKINSLAFTPEGKTLISGSEDNTIRIWDADKGHELRRFSVGPRGFFDFALSRDGKILASRYGRDGIVGLWDMAEGKLLRELRVLDAGSVAYSPDGKTLATTGRLDNTLRLWDVATGKELRHAKGFTCSGKVAYSPNGKILACSTAANAGAISLRDPATAAEVVKPPGHKETISSVSFSEDGKTLRTSDSEGILGCWNVATGKPISPLRPPRRDRRLSEVLTPFGSHILTPTYISRDGNRAAVVGGDKHIYLWHPATGEIIYDIGQPLAGEPSATMQRLALSAEGSILAAVHQDGTLRLWDAAAGRQIGQFGEEKAANKPDFYCPIFSAKSKVLAAVARHDGTIRLWDVQTKQEIRRLKARFKNVSTLALSPEGSLLISMSPSPSARPEDLQAVCQLWNVTTGEELSQFQDRQLGWIPFDGWAFSPDGKILAINQKNTIQLWEVATGRERRRLEGHRGMVWCLTFSMDGRLLASGGSDHTALIWDVTSQPEGDPLPAQRQVLWDALGSPDAAHAYKAICSLIADRSSVSFLQQKLHAVASPDRTRITRLVADLDSDRFAARDQATHELEDWSELAEPALSKALANQPSLEARRRIEQLLQILRGPVTNLERLQALRSVEVLEHIGTPEARQVLEKLAGGTAEARLTREAKMALERFANGRN